MTRSQAVARIAVSRPYCLTHCKLSSN